MLELSNGTTMRRNGQTQRHQQSVKQKCEEAEEGKTSAGVSAGDSSIAGLHACVRAPRAKARPRGMPAPSTVPSRAFRPRRPKLPARSSERNDPHVDGKL